MARCIHCRREVERSMSRIGGRRLRHMRSLKQCSAAECVSFLSAVERDALRLHLASMAWWRFSAASDRGAEAIRRVMVGCVSREPDSGTEYMHHALHVLSPLSQEQLAVWFGFENLHQAASLFSGGLPYAVGEHCRQCRLYKLGCTDYDKIGADDCPLWSDRFVQGVASAIRKAGGAWDDPCAGIPDGK